MIRAVIKLIFYMHLLSAACYWDCPVFGADSETFFVFSQEQGAVPNNNFILGEQHNLAKNPLSFAFYDKDGNKLRIEDFKEKSLFVYLWAPWCLDCINGMKGIDSMAADIVKQSQGNMKIIPISLDSSVANIENFYVTHSIANLDIFFIKNDSLGRDFGHQTIPSTMVVNNNGSVIEVMSGVICCNLEHLQGMIR